MKRSIKERISVAFNEHRGTLTLLEDLVRERKNPQEIVILACSRLDALANLAMTQKKSQRDRFTSFLHTYSGRSNELKQVALPNMYFDMVTQSEILSVTLPAPGRMFAYDIARDAVFLQFIVDSGVPLTSDGVRKLLLRLSMWLQQAYRTTVTQRKSKPHHDTVAGVIRHLEACSRVYRKGLYNQAVEKIRPFVRQFCLADLVYRDYRCRSIHEFCFEPDERFFTEPGTYVATRFHAWDATRFLEVSVSARWLIELYRATIQRYERALLACRKLPIELWGKLCDTSELSFLDDSSIPVGRDLNIRVQR